MKIAVYTVCYNEQDLLPFFMRHYSQYTTRIVVYDNGSTDNSLNIIKNFGCECRTFSTQDQIRDDLLTNLKNNCWKECRGQGYDWVIVVDMDEFVYHPDFIKYLTEAKDNKITLCVPEGYQMVSCTPPDFNSTSQIYNTHKYGVYSAKYSKPCMFNPDAIKEIRYKHGAHAANPIGAISKMTGHAKLLHYSLLSLDWALNRINSRRSRISAINRKNRWGWEYLKVDQYHKDNFIQLLQQARPVC